ncbi:MAG: dienelactone hydrolase [Rhodospirillaceae bacterium]|nr:dienelactone hydrolase [Rhodospirillaceae bacterium]
MKCLPIVAAFFSFVIGMPGALANAVPPIDAVKKEMVTLSVVIDGDDYDLEAQILTPPGEGPRPLAIVTHGSPRRASSRSKMTTHQYFHRAMEFARRGYVTAIVMRRGYGRSEGRWYEEYGECDFPYYDKAAFTTASDIIAAIAELKKRPGIDANRILVVGQSAGGIGAVAVAAKNPPGVVAAINFAGGRGSRSHGEVCSEGELVDAFETFGETARMPTLWVYAENDGFFNPRLARRFYEAFTEAGGKADLIQTGPFGRDGHGLFSYNGISRWRPMVDDFLRKIGLPTWETPPDLPRAPIIEPPEGLSAKGQDHWRRYLNRADNKAFAKSRTGSWFGWRSRRNTIDDAKEGALGNCKADDCEIISINGSPPMW